eukprot:Opistho-2@65526
MGLLSLGTPLAWEEAKKYADHVRRHGIAQFLSIHRRLKDRTGDSLKWGDEVEYIVGSLDPTQRTAQVSLRCPEMLRDMNEEENNAGPDDILDSLWRPEYGSFMIEGTPGRPYGSTVRDFVTVEANMHKRRLHLRDYLKGSEVALTVTSFPRLGCDHFTDPQTAPQGPYAQSLFFPDDAINPHKRFPTLSANIRERRGRRVVINVPIYKDINTPSPYVEAVANADTEFAAAVKPDHIYMDAMGFGMGCCCLQATFQACSIDEARHLYDQLAVLSPIMMALTAAAPIYRGHLADVDCRWDVISQSVDDRTAEELGERPLKESRFVINKSRYDSIDCYISNGPMMKDAYNDIDLVYDRDIYKTLVDGGIDDRLSRHMAHLFIRDPLVVYRERIDQDDENDSDHFENIQSTNWQTVRFKPPPPNNSIGWRVEFRSMEVQLTDFDNTAFIVFLVLMTRVILSYGLNFYTPISKVDENMRRGQKRNACLAERFHFRKSVAHDPNSNDDATEEMTIDAIMNGKAGFPGLIPMIQSYLNTMDVDVDARCTIAKYLDLVSKRASGELQTTASWIRAFVDSHSDYKHDSIVPESTAHDLLVACGRLGYGELSAPTLLGPNYPRKN